MRLDFHADDFGATSAVTSNIAVAWQKGVLTGFSVLANGEAVREAAEVANASAAGQPRIAVHLNLTEGRPLLDPMAVPSVVDSSGRFHLGFLGLLGLWHRSTSQHRRHLLRQVEDEWRAQIQSVRSVFSPCPVVGVDGHIHVHMLPFLFPIAARLARDFNIPEIRISNEVFHLDSTRGFDPAFAKNFAKQVLLSSLTRRARRTAESCGLTGAERIAGILYSGRLQVDSVLAAIRAAHRRRLDWLEIVCHPGRAAQSDAARWARQPWLLQFYMDPARDTERDALISLRSRLRPDRRQQ
ncbi:MAG: ChbG/HpnK family deacetylase [Gemmatimonadota bacterium]